MSSRCSGAVFERYPQGGGEFVLALALADNAHHDGSHIFISVEAMAHKSRQSVRAVQMHLRAMLASGWLCVTCTGGGRGRYAEYHINPAWLKGADVAPITPPPEHPRGGVNGADSAPFEDAERVQNDARKGAKRRTPYITVLTLIPPTPLAGGACPDETPGPESPHSGEFEALVAAYPRRARLDQARKAWQAIAPSPGLHAEMLRAVDAWKASEEWRREQGRYVPKLAKWLTDKRWLDAPRSAGAAAPAPAAVLPDLPPPAPIPAESRAKIAQLLARAPLRKAVPA